MSRRELVLSARSGALIRAYHAAQYGGAVAADAARTVIIGTTSVTCYDNATGRPVWSRGTGKVEQAWRVDSGELYVTVAAGGSLGTAPVTALRRIDLRTGAEQVIRPASGPFAGTLSGAIAGVALFSGPGGLSAYSATTGRRLWHRTGVVPETLDEVRHTLYVTSSNLLVGIDPQTGRRIRGAKVPGSSAIYQVQGGVAIGLDQGSLGDAWGYNVARHRVVWTSPALPWPHYFVDAAGLGGSSAPAGSTILLTACAALGRGPPDGSAQPCSRPELVALSG